MQINRIWRSITLACLVSAGAVLLVFSCGTKRPVPEDVYDMSIVPLPSNVETSKGLFTFDGETAILYPSGNNAANDVADYFARMLGGASGLTFNTESFDQAVQKNNAVIFSIEPGVGGAEGYHLSVTPDAITVTATTAAGLFYGVQTLRELLPVRVESRVEFPGQITWAVPCVEIDDSPRFPWRGMHLDVSRHFFDKDEVKRLLDCMALLKMNVFHWHLVDGAGWRIQIDAYPRLTEVGGWRKDISDEEWSFTKIRHAGPDDDKPPYGGFYTKDDIREIVAYAAKRHITVVPEIEMPGHSNAALAAYPELLCPNAEKTNIDYENSGVFCAGREETFTFLETVLDEVIDLFPSPYIHVGGDEVPKRYWEACPYCQKRIKDEKLADENELQSYFIKRMETFLNSRGKKLIGWDEILEGGLAPEATVMSWRGMEGGTEAARQGHDVIMTPEDFCYFNHYQGDPGMEPRAWGGFTPLSEVYAYDPVPADLGPDEAHFILGTQGCVWSEFIQTPEMLEYMILPRMAALAEVAWSELPDRDFSDFKGRMTEMYRRFGMMGMIYARSAFNVNFATAIDSTDWSAVVTMSADAADIDIRYTLDGSEPSPQSPIYVEQVVLSTTAVMKSASFEGNSPASKVTSISYFRHLANGKCPSFEYPYSRRFSGAGPCTLVNGLRGSKNYDDGQWQGLTGDDLVAVIDFGEARDVSSVTAAFFHSPGVWIFMPSAVECFVSGDGTTFSSIARLDNDTPQNTDGPIIKEFVLKFDTTPVRYLKVQAKSLGVCPDWHVGAGRPVWLFADEIIVE